jgi:hypothetical protein
MHLLVAVDGLATGTVTSGEVTALDHCNQRTNIWRNDV